jgi:hypothetical protein
MSVKNSTGSLFIYINCIVIVTNSVQSDNGIKF